jgi:F0F1-type ATP synthase membrane subunit b/b'
MLAFLFSTFLLFAETGSAAKSDSAWGSFVHFWNTYLNYPGFEAWRFFNLALFVAIMAYLLKKPLSNAFKAKREAIRAELIRAEEEKQAALAQLTSAEAKLVRLDMEAEQVRAHARQEADAEKRRIAEQTLQDIAKMRQQAESEITRLSQQIKSDLRRFSAEESIRLAEERIRTSIDADKDARLVRANIQAIGGLN